MYQENGIDVYGFLHIYIKWNIIQPYKEENLAICDSIGGTREHYAKCSKSNKEKYCMISYLECLKKKVWIVSLLALLKI